MTKRFYLDTSIWRDYFEDRGNGVRPLGEFAFQFLRYCEEMGFEVLVSDTVLLELEDSFSKEQINEILFSFKSIVKYILVTHDQYSEARNEWFKQGRRLPFNDVLHAILARDNDAVLVTRDKHFFEMLTSIVEVKMPEEIISA